MRVANHFVRIFTPRLYNNCFHNSPPTDDGTTDCCCLMRRWWWITGAGRVDDKRFLQFDLLMSYVTCGFPREMRGNYRKMRNLSLTVINIFISFRILFFPLFLPPLFWALIRIFIFILHTQRFKWGKVLITHILGAIQQQQDELKPFHGMSCHHHQMLCLSPLSPSITFVCDLPSNTLLLHRLHFNLPSRYFACLSN